MKKAKLKSLLISPDITIKQAMQKITDAGEKIIFVVDGNDALIGTVTDGDIRRGIINGLELTSPLKEVMRTKFVSVNENCPNYRKKAKELMKKHFIEYVPVLDRRHKLVDIVSWIEFVNGAGRQENIRQESPIIIMAGGKGTRLDPFTKILPKPLIPVGNKPIIEHIIDRFHERGFYKFILVLNYKKEMIKLYFRENEHPYEIEFIDEGDFYGTAGGLHLFKKKLKETFIVTNCDTILEADYGEFFRWHQEKKNMMTIIGSHREVVIPYGVLHMNNGSFVDMKEKPKFDLFINTGTYVLEPEVLGFLDENSFMNMDELILKAKEKYLDKVSVFPHWGKWFDIGHWDEYRLSIKQLESREADV
ncbi:MAG: CBS domain-containing protein [Deltaproteobacteria bacterium]|nr:CBS domain-containing protein [Deltaproteobacteria bacterium]